MNAAEKLRFLADRVEDGKDFYINDVVVERFEFIESKKEEVIDNEVIEDEKVILRNLPEKYKWLVRDKTKNLFISQGKPLKHGTFWDTVNCHISYEIIIYKHLFQSIQWEDEEPCEFRRYL